MGVIGWQWAFTSQAGPPLPEIRHRAGNVSMELHRRPTARTLPRIRTAPSSTGGAVISTNASAKQHV
jgi:hypothetical protein